MRSGDNKLIFLFVLIVGVLIISITFISAYDTGSSVGGSDTLVKGKIYCENTNDCLAGVEILVKCYHLKDGLLKMNRMKGITTCDGNYAVYFEAGQCDQDDRVVAEIKGDSSLNAEGIVKDKVLGNMDVVVIDIPFCSVPVVPEFGIIAGTLTILGAVGTFLVIRKKGRVSRKNSKKK